MPEALSEQAELAERRVYHARFICYLAVLPVAAGFAAVATAGAFGDRDSRIALTHTPAILVGILYAGLFLLAAWLLDRRQRAGAVLGLVLFTAMLLSNLRSGGIALSNVVFAIAGIALIARAWPAMTPGSRVVA